MTYKSTTFKPKINVDSTLLKCLNLQPTFHGPPPPLYKYSECGWKSYPKFWNPRTTFEEKT